MATPHITARPGEIAPLVLMPGDPRRARRIAEGHFDDWRLVSEVRGIECFTGTWNGTPMSVMASGMGIPSISIYAEELYREYGVQRICRVGTCGGIAPDIKVRDVVIGLSAHTNSQVATLQAPGLTLALAASHGMVRGAVETAEAAGIEARVGAVFSSDFFYATRPDIMQVLTELGTLGVEMEAAGLYFAAMRHRREALAVLTVSDHLEDDSEDMSPEDRETIFERALTVAAGALLT